MVDRISPDNQAKSKFLIKEYGKFIRKKKELAKVKEPIVVLLRNTGGCEVFTGIEQKELKIDHTDGKERRILLDSRYQYSLPYGKDTLRTYFCHEDFRFPLPPTPLLDSENIDTMITKVMADSYKWKAIEERERNQKWLMIAIAIGVLLVLFALANNMTQGKLLEMIPGVAKQAVPAAQQAVKNISTSTIQVIQ